jgi:6-phosphofructokinase 2
MNPAIDKSTMVDALIPDKKLRCNEVLSEAGGGGINISKAIKKLGGETICLFPSGGVNGKLLEEYLSRDEIRYHSIPIQQNIRESFTVNESHTQKQYRFVLPGPELSEAEISACLDALTKIKTQATYIVASGSLPAGAPEDFFGRLAAISKRLNARFIIDSSGKPLQIAAKEGVYMLKPNLSELCSLAGKEHLELNEVDDAAMEVVKKGNCEVMVVSLGPSGALLVTANGYEHIPAPTVRKNTTVGAGDSMVAGMVWKLSQGKSIKETVQFGVACGTAATMNRGTQLFNVDDVNRLYHWMVTVSEKHRLNLDN